MKILNKAFIVLLAVAAIGCSKSSDSKDNGGGSNYPNEIPDSISQKPESGPVLNQAQKDMFVRLMADEQVAQAPDYLTPAASETYQQKNEREKRLNEASLATKDFADVLRQKCVIRPGTENTQGQLINPGDQAKISELKMMSGNGCPVDWKFEGYSLSTLVSVDQATEQIVVNYETRNVNVFKLKDASLSRLVAIVDLGKAIEAKGRIEYTASGMRLYTVFNLTATGKTAAGDVISYKGNGEVLIKDNTQTSKVTIYSSYRKTDFVLTVLTTSNPYGKSDTQLFLNGEKLEVDQSSIHVNGFIKALNH